MSERPKFLEPITPRSTTEAIFEELGIEKESHPHLNLIKEKIRLHRVSKGGSQLYFGFVDHPFLGTHLNGLLDSLTPFGTGGIVGIENDLLLPEQAAKHQSLALKKLHAAHENDPVIGKAYREFVANNLNAWRRSLLQDDYDTFFTYGTDRVVVINTDSYVHNSLQSLKDELTLAVQDGYNISEAFHLQQDIAGIAQRIGNGHLFIDYLSNQVEEFIGKPWLSKEKEAFGYVDHIYNGENEFTTRRLVEIWKRFLETLSPEDQEKFVMAHDTGITKILIDPVRKKVWQDDEWRPVNVGLYNDRSFSLVNDQGLRIQGAITLTDKAEHSWKINAYEFPQEYKKQGLYPLLAWKTAGNKRRFLSQGEIGLFQEELGIKGDTALGRVIAAYFSPDVTARFPKMMRLKGREEKQQMMGAQVPVWVSLPKHAEMLLSDKNEFFGNLEKAVA